MRNDKLHARNESANPSYFICHWSFVISHFSFVKTFSARLFASFRLGGEGGVRCFHREDAKTQRIAKNFACLLAASGFFLSACSEKEAPPPSKPVVPVVVAAAVLKDVPVQLNAIGTVEAYSTVTDKTQVSGELMQVYFKEDQEGRGESREGSCPVKAGRGQPGTRHGSGKARAGRNPAVRAADSSRRGSPRTVRTDPDWNGGTRGVAARGRCSHRKRAASDQRRPGRH